MNWLDIVIIVFLGIGFYKGYSDGFIRQIVALVALLAAIYLCSKVAVFLREYILQTGWFAERSVTLVSYVAAFILILVVVTAAGGIVNKMMNATPLNIVNHLAGGVFGLIITLFILSLTLNFVEGLDKHSFILSQETKVESKLYYHVREIVPTIYPADLFVWRK